MDILFNNDKKIYDEIINFSALSEEILIITAFFTFEKLIENWIQDDKKIKLLVSLRPPTNYYLLKDILHHNNIEIKFLGSELHSKIYVFLNEKTKFNKVIIGSSNFTTNGFCSNIESNVIIDDQNLISGVERYFYELFENSNSLQPTDLDNYKSIYDSFVKNEDNIKKEVDDFDKKINYKNRKNKNKIQIREEAKKYYDFWKIVDDVKNIVKDISDQEYPGIPHYLTVDHFWHWIKVILNKDIRVNKDKEVISNLFKEYCKWDKNQGNYTQTMFLKSKNIFKKYLSIENIDNLSIDKALEVYRNLHSTGMPIQRFKVDEKFKDNNIQNIIKSFKYLLYSDDEIAYRLSMLMDKHSEFKLNKFGDSSIQELNGWVNPEKYPIRNDKADDAVRILGYIL